MLYELTSKGVSKDSINYVKLWAQFENLGELVKNTIFVA